MITLANDNMKPDLITIWQQCFGDSAEYIQMFLDWNFTRIKTVVYVVEDRPVSVAYLMPVTYVEAGNTEMPCLYLYAAATLPEYRGHGYFGEILKYIDRSMPEPVLLVPGEESLISFYEKQGFHIWLRERRIERPCGSVCLNPSHMFPITFQQYFTLREEILTKSQHNRVDLLTSEFESKGYIRWSKSFIEYICRENEFCGGGLAKIYWGEQCCVMMYRKEQGKLKLLELLPQNRAMDIAEALSAEICLQPTIMVSSKWKIAKEKGYFNLIMG